MAEKCRRSSFRLMLAASLLILAALRITLFSARIAREGMQVDFAAFYIAGRSEAEGLNPYLNYPEHRPDIWFGLAPRQHSRFLYPPFAATLFRPLAAMPYSSAKVGWIIISLGGVACGAIASAFFLGGRKAGLLALAALVLAFLFHPTLVLIERGQIDGLTFPLCVFSIILLSRGAKTHNFAAGFLLAWAILLKLHIVMIAPFMILRRRFSALWGLATGIAAISLLSLLLNGPREISDYVFRQLPRISYYEAGGPAESLIPKERYERLRAGIQRGFARAEGKLYRIDYFRVIGCPSIAYAIYMGLLRAGKVVSLSLPSVCVFTVLFVLWTMRWRTARPEGDRHRLSVEGEFAWWLAVLALILLSAPVTRVSNTVWMIPAGILALSQYHILKSRAPNVLYMISAGVLFIAMPDNRAGLGELSTSTVVDFLFSTKYIAGEILLVCGLAGFAEISSSFDAKGDGNAANSPST